MAQGASNVTALRQQTAQQERVVIPDPMPYPDEAILGGRRVIPAPGAPAGTTSPTRSAGAAVTGGGVVLPRPKQPSSLFAQAPATTASDSAPAGDSVARSLFQSATGLFRKRTLTSLEPEAPVRRREPVATNPPQMLPSEDLPMATERPMGSRATALDDSGLDIPAFLRRQSS
jgi:hypothetical protein